MEIKKLWYILLLFCLVLCFNFCFSVEVAQAEILLEGNNFIDIKGHWAEKQIEKWAQGNLVAGYVDGTFKPDHDITRAEFVVVVNRVFGYTETTALNFIDVGAEDWYALDIAKAKAVGCISGYPDGSFRPNQSISRQEVAAVLTKILSLKGTETNMLAKFVDQAEFPVWSFSSIKAITEKGYMSGYPDGTFRPTKALTRAEIISVLDRILPFDDNQVGASWIGTGKILDRLGASVGKSPGADFDSLYPWSEMKLCNVADDGTITAYFGEADFKRDGSNGQVMVKIPKFYYKRTYDEVNKVYEFWIADQEKPGYKLHAAFSRQGVEKPYILVGTYRGGVVNNKLVSIAKAAPAVKRTRAEFRQLAQKRGIGWSQIDIQTWSALQLLYLIEYVDADCQKVIKDSSYRGIESLWGGQGQFIDGINVNTDLQFYVAENDFADSMFGGNYKATRVFVPNSPDVQKEIAFSAEAEWLLITCEAGKKESSVIGYPQDLVLAAGGCWSADIPGDLFTIFIADPLAEDFNDTGARILYIP